SMTRDEGRRRRTRESPEAASDREAGRQRPIAGLDRAAKLPPRPRIWHLRPVARDPAPPAPESAPWFDRALALFSTALPFGLALSRAASAGQWRDDLPAVRDLGFVAVGVGGGVSTLVTQALCLI